MTNADVIREMTDDELYEFLSEWECGDIDYAVTFCDLCNDATKRGEVGNVLNLDCDGCRKHWLTRKADEYGGLLYWVRNKDFADRKVERKSCQKCEHENDDKCMSPMWCNYKPKDEPKTNKVVEKRPTPIRDFMVNGKTKDEPQTDTHDIRTNTHECVKDTHDKDETNCSEKPNNCEDEPQSERSE